MDSGGHIALRETEFRTGYPAWREPDRIVSLGDDTWFARVGLRFH